MELLPSVIFVHIASYGLWFSAPFYISLLELIWLIVFEVRDIFLLNLVSIRFLNITQNLRLWKVSCFGNSHLISLMPSPKPLSFTQDFFYFGDVFFPLSYWKWCNFGDLSKLSRILASCCSSHSNSLSNSEIPPFSNKSSQHCAWSSHSILDSSILIWFPISPWTS